MFTTFMQPWPMVPSDAGEKSDRRAQMYEWLDEEREKRVSVGYLSILQPTCGSFV